MTILLLSLIVISLVLGELFGLFERTDHLSSRLYVASAFVGVLLVAWLIAEYSVGESIIPEPFHSSYWSGLKISVEKCTIPC